MESRPIFDGEYWNDLAYRRGKSYSGSKFLNRSSTFSRDSGKLKKRPSTILLVSPLQSANCFKPDASLQICRLTSNLSGGYVASFYFGQIGIWMLHLLWNPKIIPTLLREAATEPNLIKILSALIFGFGKVVFRRKLIQQSGNKGKMRLFALDCSFS